MPVKAYPRPEMAHPMFEKARLRFKKDHPRAEGIS